MSHLTLDLSHLIFYYELFTPDLEHPLLIRLDPWLFKNEIVITL